MKASLLLVLAAAALTACQQAPKQSEQPDISKPAAKETTKDEKGFVPTKQAGDDSAISERPLTIDEGKLRSLVEMARQDIRLRKSVVVAQNMDLTESEAADFWPLHREYEVELAKTTDRKIAVIEKFLKSYEKLTDADATTLANEVFDIEAARVELKKTYFAKFSKVVPATKAARFFQIENQLNMLIDLQIAAALPMIK